MPTRRQRQVSSLIHRELSLLLLLDARDPRLAGVTITEVDVTRDLLSARVHFTVLGDGDEGQEAQAALDHAASYLRTQLAGRVELRFVPELIFRLDKSAQYARRIEELLDRVKDDDDSGEDLGTD
ncbi:30S ribosome-binding factor RbfA [Chloroflexota bacterium]